MKASPEQLKETRKLEILLSQSRVGLVGGSIVTTLAVYLCWATYNHVYLLSWLLFYCTLGAVRYQLTRIRFRETPQSRTIDKIRNRYTALTILSGASWGVMSLYVLAGSAEFGSILVILAVSLTACSSSVYAIYPSIHASFSIPALLPPTVYLFLQGGKTENIYGLLLIVFLLLISISAIFLRRLVMNSIGIQFENMRLLDDIEREKTQVSDLNRTLQLDLEELRKRDMQLSEEKERAEDLAEKLLVLSTRDGLTGIANRRYFDEYLAKEWNRAVRSGSQLSLILCDIDYFKAYNDYYGHQEGDYCLQKVANILEEYTRRENDLAARYGGEEFAIILPDTALDNAVTVAEKIRTAVERTAITHAASDIVNIVTVSMGVSTIKPDRSVYSQILVAEADRLLYRAKSLGRNRVVAGQCDFEPMDDTGEDKTIERAITA